LKLFFFFDIAVWHVSPGDVDTLSPILLSVPWQQHAIGQYLMCDFDDFDRHIQETSKLMQNNWK